MQPIKLVTFSTRQIDIVGHPTRQQPRHQSVPPDGPSYISDFKLVNFERYPVQIFGNFKLNIGVIILLF